MKFLTNILKKRQSVKSPWIPYLTSTQPSGVSDRLSAVGKCLRVYTDFLLSTPLEPKEHYLNEILEKPNRWMSKKNFYECLVSELLLNGNFYCKVNFNTQGKVTALLPFRAGQIYAYPSQGEYDPLTLESKGFFFRDFKGRIFAEHEILKISDYLFSRGDNLNAPSRIYIYANIFDAGYSIQEVQKALAQSGMRGAVVLTGLDDSDSDSVKDIRENVEKFTQGDSGGGIGKVLSLPSGYSTMPMQSDSSPSKMLDLLIAKTDLDLSRVFGVPQEIIGRVEGDKGGTPLKESYRFFIKSSLIPFLKCVSDALSDLAMDGTKFKFRTELLKASDLREQAQFLKVLTQEGIITKQEAKKWVGL